MAKTASAILLAAADLIEPAGAWTQKSYFNLRDDGTPCFCLLGAIIEVAPNDDVGQHGARVALTYAIDSSDIIGFNDAPERTQAEAVAACRKAAELAQ